MAPFVLSLAAALSQAVELREKESPRVFQDGGEA
jgi:hypothetical protein